MGSHENEVPLGSKLEPDTRRERGSWVGVWGCLVPALAGVLCGLTLAWAAAIVASTTIPLHYTATAWLRIARSKPSIVFKVGGDDSIVADREAQAVLVKSRFVLSTTLRKPNVACLECLQDEEDKVTWLQEHIDVSFPGDSEIMQIAMTGSDPSELVSLVNAVQDSYMEEVVGADRENQLRRKRVLEESYCRNVEDVKKRSRRLRELAEALGVSEEPETAKIAIQGRLQAAAVAKDRVSQIRGKLRGVEAKIAAIDGLKGGAERDAKRAQDLEALVKQMVGAALEADHTIAQANARIAVLEDLVVDEKKKLRETAEDPPSVSKLREQISGLKRDVAARTESLRPQIEKQARADVARQTAALSTDTSEAVGLERIRLDLERTALREELAEAESFSKTLVKDVEAAGTLSEELRLRQGELERLKEMAGKMGQELDQWEVELAAAPRVTVLERASFPKTSDVARKTRIVLFAVCGAFAAGFVVGAGLAAALQRLLRRRLARA
jgi:succinoglycan biosynthesis transport protein ExoP